jgi:hypothetical protein
MGVRGFVQRRVLQSEISESLAPHARTRAEGVSKICGTEARP